MNKIWPPPSRNGLRGIFLRIDGIEAIRGALKVRSRKEGAAGGGGGLSFLCPWHECIGSIGTASGNVSLRRQGSDIRTI